MPGLADWCKVLILYMTLQCKMLLAWAQFLAVCLRTKIPGSSVPRSGPSSDPARPYAVYVKDLLPSLSSDNMHLLDKSYLLELVAVLLSHIDTLGGGLYLRSSDACGFICSCRAS
ncbi:hypothetical protein B0H11DRAFT_2014243 [Mycena galericulata]|nr:hypothetical protein B0H11DRAFT_2014243 [Mycena galericulata]